MNFHIIDGITYLLPAFFFSEFYLLFSGEIDFSFLFDVVSCGFSGAGVGFLFWQILASFAI